MTTKLKTSVHGVIFLLQLIEMNQLDDICMTGKEAMASMIGSLSCLVEPEFV